MKTFIIRLVALMLAGAGSLAMSRPQPAPKETPVPLPADTSTNLSSAVKSTAPPVAGSNPAETGPGLVLFRGTFGASSNIPPSAPTDLEDATITPPDLSVTPRSGGGSDVIPGTSGVGSGR